MTATTEKAVPAGSSRGQDDATLLLDYVLRPWRQFLSVPLLTAVAGLSLALVLPKKYTSVGSFVPETEDVGRSIGALAGLASQLGFGLAGSGQSPQFYAQVLQSRGVLTAALYAKVQPVRAASSDGRLIDFLVGPQADSARREERALRKLRRGVSTTVNPRTNVVELQVTLGDPRVARQTASRLLDELNRFNLQQRRSRGGERRRFVESRLREMGDSLRAAEGALMAFLVRNREYRSAPALVAVHDRLQRQVTLYQSIFSGLRRDFDGARLDEVNDTPLFSLIDAPVAAVKPSSPSRLGAVVVGFALGAVLVAVVASLRVFAWRWRTQRPGQWAALSRFVAGERHRS